MEEVECLLLDGILGFRSKVPGEDFSEDTAHHSWMSVPVVDADGAPDGGRSSSEHILDKFVQGVLEIFFVYEFSSAILEPLAEECLCEARSDGCLVDVADELVAFFVGSDIDELDGVFEVFEFGNESCSRGVLADSLDEEVECIVSDGGPFPVDTIVIARIVDVFDDVSLKIGGDSVAEELAVPKFGNELVSEPHSGD